jgi:hypothetical protein
MGNIPKSQTFSPPAMLSEYSHDQGPNNLGSFVTYLWARVGVARLLRNFFLTREVFAPL